MSWDRGRRWLTRAPVLLAAFLLSVGSLTAGVVVTVAAPAHAAPGEPALGEVRLTQDSGTVDGNPIFATGTTNACPAGFGENANLRIGQPGGPYSNLAPALGGGGYDTHEISINPNRSFQTAIGHTPEAGVWWIVMECYSLTEGRHHNEFRTVITVCGSLWKVGDQCATATPTVTALAVNPDEPSIEAGTAVTLTATVTPATAGGEVTFRRTTGGTVVPLGSAAVSGGSATLTVPDLPGPEGSNNNVTHSLSAEFTPADPNANLGSLSTPRDIKVYCAGCARPTTLGLTVDKTSPQPVGTVLELTAALDVHTAVGKVRFKYAAIAAGSETHELGLIDVAGGSAKLPNVQLTEGTWNLTANFEPTEAADFLPATASVTNFRIGAGAAANSTTTQLSVTPDSPQLQGTVVTITATVTPSTATGTVKFLDGTTELGEETLVSGSASTGTSTLAVGTHALKATFEPADAAQFATSSSDVKQYVITAPPEGGDDLTVLDANGSELGENPSLHRGDTVTVIGRGFAATESVAVQLDGTDLSTVNASDGVAQYAFTVPSDAAEGAHQMMLNGASHQVEFDFTVVAGDGGGGGDDGDGGGGGGGTLPRTGLPLIGIGLAGLVLVGLGAATTLAARRREQPGPVAWSDAAPGPE
jgi:hypothetical protein